MTSSARKRILIDARALRPDATSNHTYWRELTHELVRSDAPFDWLLATNKDIDVGFLSGLANWQVVQAGSPNDRVWSWLDLPRLATRQKVDLVHVQYSVSPFFRCPVVTTVHDVSFFVNPEWLPPRDAAVLQKTVPYACRKAAAVIVVSESVKRDLLKFIDVPADKVWVTPLGAPPLTKHSEWTHSDYFLLVGGLSPRKNWKLAVEAVSLARKKADRPLRLVITGPNSGQDLTDLPSWVELPGSVSRSELEALYAGAIALIHPALYEGFGLTPLESWAHGTPVILSSIEPFLSSYAHSDSFVEGWDPNDWGAAALSLLDPESRRKAARLGSQLLSLFTWDESARATLSVYQNVLRR